MNKAEFLAGLRDALAGKLPSGELEDVLSYYCLLYTSVKVVLLDEQNKLLFRSYERHYSKARERAAETLRSLADRLAGRQVRIVITGSAGLGVAKAAEIDFVQEVYATAAAVNQYIPCLLYTSHIHVQPGEGRQRRPLLHMGSAGIHRRFAFMCPAPVEIQVGLCPHGKARDGQQPPRHDQEGTSPQAYLCRHVHARTSLRFSQRPSSAAMPRKRCV